MRQEAQQEARQEAQHEVQPEAELAGAVGVWEITTLPPSVPIFLPEMRAEI